MTDRRSDLYITILGVMALLIVGAFLRLRPSSEGGGVPASGAMPVESPRPAPTVVPATPSPAPRPPAPAVRRCTFKTDAEALRLILDAPLDDWDPYYGCDDRTMKAAGRAARREAGR